MLINILVYLAALQKKHSNGADEMSWVGIRPPKQSLPWDKKILSFEVRSTLKIRILVQKNIRNWGCGIFQGLILAQTK